MLGLALCSAAQARILYWQGFDTLAEGDRDLAEAALTEEFGADTNQWPDWIDPMALYAPRGMSISSLSCAARCMSPAASTNSPSMER